MADKKAMVHWQGQGKKGTGKISTETAALQGYPYGFGSRFEDDRKGTNPEELLAAAHAGLEQFGYGTHEETAKMLTAGNPIQRMAEPEDIANMAAFLACDESSFLTGTVMTVDAGSTA